MKLRQTKSRGKRITEKKLLVGLQDYLEKTEKFDTISP